MNITFEELSPTQRLRLVQEYWDRIAANPDDVPVTGAMVAELERRLKEHRASPDDVVSWADVKAKAERE